MRCLAVLTTAAVLAGAELPIVVGHVVRGPVSQVELTNTGDQPATAWIIAVTTPGPNGGIHRVFETIDAYLSEATQGLPGSSTKTDRLFPGQSRTIPLDPLGADATVEVVAVVLEDGTARGEANSLTSIFERRAAERDELHKVVDIFNNVLPTKHGIPALEELRARLRNPAGSEESVPHRAAREAVDSYARVATSANADDIDRRLRTYVAFVQREYELAVRHSHRKTP